MEKNQVLAIVGGKEITNDNVDFLMKTLDPQTASQFNSEAGKRELLNELINQELIYLDAIDNGLSEDENLKAELEKAKENLIKQFAVRKILEGVSLKEEEALQYYNENEQHFIMPESVRASHILVDTEESVNEALAELKNDVPFPDVAKKYSKCPSKNNGGDLGYFSRGKMVPEFENAAFSLEKEVISEPVKTQFGYHIIKVSDKRAETVRTFEETKNQIMQHLLSNKQQQTYFNKIDSLKGKYEVKILE